MLSSASRSAAASAHSPALRSWAFFGTSNVFSRGILIALGAALLAAAAFEAHAIWRDMPKADQFVSSPHAQIEFTTRRDQETGSISTPLVVESPEIHAHAVTRGGQACWEFLLRNSSSVSVEIQRVETGCDCVRVHGLCSNPIPPQGTAKGELLLDLSHDPGFVGRLAIEVRGLARGGQVAFLWEFDVNVLSRSAAQARSSAEQAERTYGE